MVVAIYLRVSTDEQTVENQRHRLKEYARIRNWTIVKEYSDEGESGANTSRPALNRLLEDVRNPTRGWDTVLAYKLDRIGRSLPHLIQIIEEMKNHGVDFILSDDPTFDTTSPHGELIFRIFGSIADYERKLNKQRQKEGIERRRREGKNLGRKKEILGAQLQKVKRLREEGLSIRQIAKECGISKSSVSDIINGVRKSPPLNSGVSHAGKQGVQEGLPFRTVNEVTQ